MLVPAANADLRPGSTHAFLVGKHGRLALPLPLPLSPPRLTGDKHGIAHVTVCVRYRVANWGAQRGTAPTAGRGAADRGGYARVRGAARRDRALVTVIVARRSLTTGPDPSKPLYRRTLVDTGGLNRQRVVRCYKFQLPQAASRFLTSHGAFARAARRRQSGRRLLSIDVQQDRDFKRVDGRYDWREGTAVGAADKARPRQSDLAFASAGTQNPYGTLSITNNTASGVYCSGCALVNKSTGLPGTNSGTMNSSTYAIPLAVAGDAVQCFDQGTNGSDPAGFANYDAAGNPQPYSAGVSQAGTPGGITLPLTSGTTVTEGLAADYSLAWAGNQQTADTSGFISGTAKLGLQAIKVGITGMLSPGAVITGIVGIFEYFLENSCKESGNYFNVTSTETNGAAASSTFNASTELWETDPGTGSTPPGLQVNPSSLTQGGSQLWLNNDAAVATGLADNACDCSNSVGNNAIELNWLNYQPCLNGYPASQCSLQPPQSPTASSPTGSVNCGTANASCAFPAAPWPPPAGQLQVYAGLSGGSNGVLWSCDPNNPKNCGSPYTVGGNDLSSMLYGGGSIWVGLSNATVLKCTPTSSNVCNPAYSLGSDNAITAMAYNNGTIYAAVYLNVPPPPGTVAQGLLYSCQPTGCTELYPFGAHTKVNAIVYANGVLYVAASNGLLYSCSPSTVDDCTTLDDTGGPSINALAYANGRLYEALNSGVLWECDPSLPAACETLDTAGAPITSLISAANGSLYAGVPEVSGNPSSGFVWQCNATQAKSCTQLTTAGPVTQLLYANSALYYGTGDSGYLYKCAANAPGNCQQLDVGSESKQYISALVAAPAVG